MPTLSVTERRARRNARKSGQSVAPQVPLPGESAGIPTQSIPHQAITDAPPPLATTTMAQGDEPVVRGNSNLQPMNATGHATARKVGQQLARLGGPDEIIPSSSQRTVDTAQEVGAQTGARMAPPNPGLESHAMGNLEGEPKTPELRKYIADLMRNSPGTKIPGQGAMSNRPGESFDEFRVRALSAVRGLLQRLASNPSSRILVPTSTQVIRLIEAWAALGCPDDLSVDTNAYLKDTPGKPGDIVRFWPEQDGKWKLTPFKPASATEFPPGLYFMRHGETDSVQALHAEAHQKARAQVIAHVRAGKWKEARDTVKAAVGSGLLSDEDAGNAVDMALPNAQDAARLAPHELLSAVSAAGPQKRQELMPVLNSRLGTMQGASPEAVQAIKQHLGRIRA